MTWRLSMVCAIKPYLMWFDLGKLHGNYSNKKYLSTFMSFSKVLFFGSWILFKAHFSLELPRRNCGQCFENSSNYLFQTRKSRRILPRPRSPSQQSGIGVSSAIVVLVGPAMNFILILSFRCSFSQQSCAASCRTWNLRGTASFISCSCVGAP